MKSSNTNIKVWNMSRQFRGDLYPMQGFNGRLPKVLGSDGGKVVSMPAFYSDDPSLNLAKVYNSFILQIVWKERIKIERGWPIFKMEVHYQNVVINLKFIKIVWSNVFASLPT